MQHSISAARPSSARIIGHRPLTWFLTLAGFLLVAAPSSAKPEQRFTPKQLQNDLAVIEHVIYDDHPDISHSADMRALSRRIRYIRRELDHPMTLDEAWRTFATLNPIMADGHMVVTFDHWTSLATEHLKNGGTFFPFEVDVATDGSMRIKSKLGGAATPLTGARIVSINGLNADKVSASLLARVHGDTPDFRAGLLSDRFWFFYWKMNGDSDAYDFVVAQNGKRHHLKISASDAKPVVLLRTSEFDNAFSFKILPCQAAVLTIKTFDWPDKQRFFDFTHQVFGRIKDVGVTTLVIDIRDNGGGDDDMWMKGFFRYIATKPYRWASRYKKRVIKGHPERGHKIGDVAIGPLDSLVQPNPNDPLHFEGKMYLLIGRHSYSSSVLFANVTQDFRFGTVVGSGGFARADTSGGDQATTLPNTGLIAAWPRFILFRPLPGKTPALLTPSIMVHDDPLHPDATIRELLRRSGVDDARCVPDQG